MANAGSHCGSHSWERNGDNGKNGRVFTRRILLTFPPSHGGNKHSFNLHVWRAFVALIETQLWNSGDKKYSGPRQDKTAEGAELSGQRKNYFNSAVNISRKLSINLGTFFNGIIEKCTWNQGRLFELASLPTFTAQWPVILWIAP